mmetsp:Transcript_13603/g.27769  ORF Transcript_13603/g.27769 Transcript_13603/m.27769 type:complete len:228 (+) Transcript_13603:199-882(+)
MPTTTMPTPTTRRRTPPSNPLTLVKCPPPPAPSAEALPAAMLPWPRRGEFAAIRTPTPWKWRGRCIASRGGSPTIITTILTGTIPVTMSTPTPTQEEEEFASVARGGEPIVFRMSRSRRVLLQPKTRIILPATTTIMPFKLPPKKVVSAAVKAMKESGYQPPKGMQMQISFVPKAGGGGGVGGGRGGGGRGGNNNNNNNSHNNGGGNNNRGGGGGRGGGRGGRGGKR